ncbi:hypothetical protein HDU83_002143 [Entophlyctis luteolus]|nr:hypothetical protein HDU83_002143 [Entophlyctis luteolus]
MRRQSDERQPRGLELRPVDIRRPNIRNRESPEQLPAASVVESADSVTYSFLPALASQGSATAASDSLFLRAVDTPLTSDSAFGEGTTANLTSASFQSLLPTSNLSEEKRLRFIPFIPKASATVRNRKPFAFRYSSNFAGGFFSHVGHISVSIVPAVIPHVIASALWALIVVLVIKNVRPSAFPNSVALASVLGSSLSLLVGFRDRFWDGCKQWYAIKSHSSNLVRLMEVFIKCTSPEEEAKKHQAFDAIIAFAYGTHHSLLKSDTETTIQALDPYIHNIATLPPLPNADSLLLYVQNYILSTGQAMPPMHNSIHSLMEAHTNLQRIRSTPIPAAYSIHLSQCIMLYILALPFQIAPSVLAWWQCVIVVAIMAFVLCGTVEISQEIEDPFGNDIDDLPVEEYCKSIAALVESIVARKTMEMGWLGVGLGLGLGMDDNEQLR